MKDFQQFENTNNAQTAYELCQKVYNYHDIIDILKSDSVIEKQAGILALKELKTQDDTDIFISNLVGQDGRIREVCAFKIHELMPDYFLFFQTKKISDILLKGVIDVNPAICRFISESLTFINDKEYLVKQIICEIKNIEQELALIPRNSRKYLLNKQIFKVYWYIEALIKIFKSAEIIFEQKELEYIVEYFIKINEYTIREKLLKLVLVIIKIGYSDFEKYLSVFKSDENFYVRNF